MYRVAVLPTEPDACADKRVLEHVRRSEDFSNRSSVDASAGGALPARTALPAGGETLAVSLEDQRERFGSARIRQRGQPALRLASDAGAIASASVGCADEGQRSLKPCVCRMRRSLHLVSLGGVE